MYYRELTKSDLIPFRVLQQTVVSSMKRKELWLPLGTDDTTFFDNVWTFFQGCFTQDGRMVGVSGLFFDPAVTARNSYEIGLDPDTTAEIGRCLVLAPFRGKGVALKMNMEHVLRAQFSGKKDLILACHPKDRGMNLSATALGMKLEHNGEYEKVPRMYYRMKLK